MHRPAADNAEARGAAGCFTDLCDMDCIRLLLKEAHVSVISPQADTFVHKLNGHTIDCRRSLVVFPKPMDPAVAAARKRHYHRY